MDFGREDEKFGLLAEDAEGRAAALASLRSGRRRLFALSLVCSAAFCFIVVAVVWNPAPVSLALVGGGSFGTLAAWMLFFKTDAEVKLLIVADRLASKR